MTGTTTHDQQLSPEQAAPFIAQIKDLKCSYDGTSLKGEPILAYPHDAGWPVVQRHCGNSLLIVDMWLYIVCPKCGYQWALWKLGVPRDFKPDYSKLLGADDAFTKQEKTLAALKAQDPEQKSTPTTRLLDARSKKQAAKVEQTNMLKIAAKAPRVKRQELADYLRGVAKTVEESNAERLNIEFSIEEVKP